MNYEQRRVPAGENFEALSALKAEGYNMLVDLCAVDYSTLGQGAKGDSSDDAKRAAPYERANTVRPIARAEGEEYGTPQVGGSRWSPEQQEFLKPRSERFELVYRLVKLDPQTGEDRGRVELRCAVGGEPALRSVASLWPIADWLEREAWDMMGIRFVDRPDIKRLYLYEQFQGHPLRKDYPITKRQPLIGPASGEPADNPSFNAARPTVKYD